MDKISSIQFKKVAKRAERAQLLVIIVKTKFRVQSYCCAYRYTYTVRTRYVVAIDPAASILPTVG